MTRLIINKLKYLFFQGKIQKFLAVLNWIPIFLAFIFILSVPKNVFHNDVLSRIIHYGIPPILTCLVCFTLSTLALLKGKREMVTLLFSLSCFLQGLLYLDISLLTSIQSERHALFISRLDHFFYVFAPAVGIHFIYLFINRKKRRLIKTLYALGALWVPLAMTEHYFYNKPFHYSWGLFERGNWAFQAFGATSTIMAIWIIILVFKKWKSESDSQKKKKFQYILFGYLSSAILTMMNLPALNGIDLYPMGNFSFISFLLLGYGIFQYNVIRINDYIKQRIIAILVKIFVALGFTILTVICIWALWGYNLLYIASRVIPYGLPPLISFISCGFFSILSLRIGENQKELLLFSVLSLFYSFLSVDILIVGIVKNAEVALQISRWDHIFVVFIPAIFIHLIYIVTEQKKRYWIVYFEYAAGVILMLFTQSDLYLQGTYKYYWGYFTKKAIMFDVMSLLTVFTVFFGPYLLFKAYRSSKNSFKKNRLFFLFLGMTCTGFLTASNIPALNGLEIYPMGNFVFVPFILLAIGMFRRNAGEAVKLLLSIIYYCFFLGLIFLSAIFIFNFYTATYLSSFIIAAIIIITSFMILSSLMGMPALLLKKTKFGINISEEKIFDELSSKRTIFELNTYIEQAFFINFHCNYIAMLYYRAEENLLNGKMIYNPDKRIFMEQPSFDNDFIVINSPESIIQLFRETQKTLTREEVEEWILNSPQQMSIDCFLRGASLLQPILYKNSLIAIMVLGGKTDYSLYSTEEKKFIHTIGLSLGAYIENAIIYDSLEEKIEERTSELKVITQKLEIERNKLKEKNEKFQQDLVLARNIQQEIIPKNNPTSYISVLYKPMEQVGGDFYDFLRFRQKNLIGIFLSDVSGHGVASAFITSMIKTIILQAGEKKQDPAELLYYMSEVLQNQTAGKFITAFYGIYDSSEKSLLYSNAGHCQPYVINESVTQLQDGKTDAPAILPYNMLQKSGKTYKNYKERFTEGTKVLFYTDGLTEAQSPETNEFFENSNMFDVFLDNKDTSSDVFLDNLYSKLVEFRQGEIFDDDINLICLNIE